MSRPRYLVLLADAPGRGRGPIPELMRSPLRRLVCMTRRTRVGNAELVGLGRSDEAEGVGCDVVVFNRLFDSRHVACGTLAACTAFRVVGVLRNGAFQSSRIFFGVAREAKLIAGDGKVRCNVAVNLMTIEATQLTMVHVALHEIVALHTILVRSQVGVLKEIRSAGL